MYSKDQRKMPVCHEDVSPDERSAMLKLGAFTGSWFNTVKPDWLSDVRSPTVGKPCTSYLPVIAKEQPLQNQALEPVDTTDNRVIRADERGKLRPMGDREDRERTNQTPKAVVGDTMQSTRWPYQPQLDD
jgi:hypothetical protein